MANVDYKFYQRGNGAYQVLPGANIAPGSGLREVSFDEFKKGASQTGFFSSPDGSSKTFMPQFTSQSQAFDAGFRSGGFIQQGQDEYSKLLAAGGDVAAAIKAAEAGATKSYGVVDDKGNLVSQKALDEEAANKQGVANGTLKEVDMGNGIKGYVPATGAAKFVPGSLPGSNPGQVVQPQSAAGGQQTPDANVTPQSTYTGNSIIDYINSIRGDSSKFGRQQLAEKYGVQGYDFSAKKNLELLEKMRSSSSSGSTSAATPVSATPGTSSTPTAPELSEQERIIKEYSDVSKALGLGDLKSQAEKVAKDLKDLNDQKAQEISDVNNNPWLSEQARGKLINSIGSKYEARTSNLMEYEKLLDSQYRQGMDQVNSIVGKIETNMARTMELAQKRQEALDKLAESDIHQANVNGRTVLVDYTTRKIVGDLGVANSELKPGGSGGGDVVSPQTYKTDLDALLGNVPNLILSQNGKAAFATSIKNARDDADKINTAATVILRNSSGDIRKDFVAQTNAIKQIDKAIALIDSGVKTGLFQAGAQYTYNIAGKDFDPKLAQINQYVTGAIQPYRNSITGAAWGTQETGEYNQLFGSTRYSPTELKQRLLGVKEIMKDSTTGALSAQVSPMGGNNFFAGTVPLSESTSKFDNIQSSITIKGQNAYLPRSVWASIAGPDKDALLQEAIDDGYTLLIND